MPCDWLFFIWTYTLCLKAARDRAEEEEDNGEQEEALIGWDEAEEEECWREQEEVLVGRIMEEEDGEQEEVLIGMSPLFRYAISP